MLPWSVIRFKFELMPAFAGWTKQKLPTTSTIQKSLSPGRRLHDLLGYGNLDKGGVAELRFDGHNVLRVVVHGAGRLLGFTGKGGQSNGHSRCDGEQFHWSIPVVVWVTATAVRGAD